MTVRKVNFITAAWNANYEYVSVKSTAFQTNGKALFVNKLVGCQSNAHVTKFVRMELIKRAPKILNINFLVKMDII